MKKGLIYAGVGIGLLGVGLYVYFRRQIELLKEYEYKIIKVKPKKFTVTEATFEIVIRFISKSNIEATIKSLYLDVFVEGNKVGYIQDNKEFIIPANGSSDIPLTISFSPKQLLPNIVDVILTGSRKRDITFEMRGYVDVYSGFIKKVVKVNYKDVISTYI